MSFEALTDSLTIAEQAALAGGHDIWNTVALADRGIPRIKVSDGPVGVRGESHTTTTSASFPCGSALGATFDAELVGRVARALADECRTKGAHVLLGPTINLARHPLGGRNFEAYAEDPVLTAHLAVAFVLGLQERGVGACVKHFVANDAEIERMTISSEVDERTLREVYLLPFEVAIADAHPWTVMGSYNRLNGVYACEHEWLLRHLLKGEWGFDGVVISDWYATHDTVRCALGGLDLEMPGPAVHFGARLAEAVQQGDVGTLVVADQARRLLRLADRVGAVAGPPPEERSEDDPARWELAREAAAASMVLLRNEPVAGGAPLLPLDTVVLRRVAVVGPNAGVAVIQGGGSARVTPHRTVTPLEGLQARLGDGVEVLSEPGWVSARRLPVLDGRLARTGRGPGIRMTYRAEPGGAVVFENTVPRLDPVWFGRFAGAIDPNHFHVTASTTLVAQRTGRHRLGLASVHQATLTVDGEPVIDTADAAKGTSFFGFGSVEVTAEVDLVAGEPHELVVEYQRPAEPLAGFRLGVAGPAADVLADAVAAAASADLAVVVVGTDEDGETEGRDRRTLALPDGQDELVRAVLAANPRTVVVVNAGAPVDLPWAEDAPAVLWMWFPGMAGGEALARVLVGDDEPAGRLPVTLPVSLADAPCDIARADPPGQLHYTERLNVGHRSYLARGVEPRYWFGHGLSYTTFEWDAPTAPPSWSLGLPLAVEVAVTNTGDRAGRDVVQAYLRRPASSVERPPWVLGGVAKVHLQPGERRVVTVPIESRMLRHWDTDGAGWQVEPGPLEVRVARSAGNAGQVVTIDVTA